MLESHRFRHAATYWPKITHFSFPTALEGATGVTPSEFHNSD